MLNVHRLKSLMDLKVPSTLSDFGQYFERFFAKLISDYVCRINFFKALGFSIFFYFFPFRKLIYACAEVFS